MKALVTGAGGFLGKAITRQLVERGDQVRNYSRNEHPDLDAMGVDQYVGDLNNAAGCSHAAEGHDLVIHVAARVGAWGSPEAYHRTNVRGTDNILKACREQGVRRLVYCSTPSVVFDGSDIEGGDESLPYPAKYLADYPRTKAEAEKKVLAANCDDLKTVALRPHLIWGPGDHQLLPRLVNAWRAGRLKRIGGEDKKIDTTYIDDAARAHILAADLLGGEDAARIAGKVYFITGGQPVPTWTMINRLLATAGAGPVNGSVSPGMAYAAGWVLECKHRLTRNTEAPVMTRWIAKELSSSHWFDISAARRDLGYEPQFSVDDGMTRLEEWVRDNPIE